MFFLFKVVQPVVAGATIIGHTFVVYMDGMLEDYFTGVFGIIYRIPYSDCKNRTLKKEKYYKSGEDSAAFHVRISYSVYRFMASTNG